MYDYQNKPVLITGGTSGIGLELAKVSLQQMQIVLSPAEEVTARKLATKLAQLFYLVTYLKKPM